MNGLRTRLIAVFVLATLLPLGLTLWITLRLLDISRDLAPIEELQAVTQSLEQTGGELFRRSSQQLRSDALEGLVESREPTQAELETFLSQDQDEAFELGGPDGQRLDYLIRRGEKVLVYSRDLGVPMDRLTQQIADAKQALETQAVFNVRRGFNWTYLIVAAALWLVALIVLVWLAARISKPVQQLTSGLGQVAAGNLKARVPEGGATGEIGDAMVAFNRMAGQLEKTRTDLIQVTRLASWQALARKMAHEVKNSLTPIRLTMEEIVSRRGKTDSAFLEQAAQIVADEVNTLERRVRAFSEFASEPPVAPAEIDVNELIPERIALLRSAHPDVSYAEKLAPGPLVATADADLLKGILLNLLENASQAVAGSREQRVIVETGTSAEDPERIYIEVHDSGPGLSEAARATLFEPTISFKKGGMGLGLSIAHRSANLCGGELQAIPGDLGGAAFRLLLPLAERAERHEGSDTTDASTAPDPQQDSASPSSSQAASPTAPGSVLWTDPNVTK